MTAFLVAIVCGVPTEKAGFKRSLVLLWAKQYRPFRRGSGFLFALHFDRESSHKWLVDKCCPPICKGFPVKKN